MSPHSSTKIAFWKFLGSALLVTGLAACGGGSGSTTTVTAQNMAAIGNQTLSLSAPASLESGKTHQLVVSNSAGAAGGAISYTASPATACTVSASGLVTAGTAGQVCMLTMSSAANAAYKAGGPVTVSISITEKNATTSNQILTVNAPSAGTSILPNQTLQTSVVNSAGTAGGALSYSTLSPSVCSVSNTGLVTAGQTGGLSCIVTVTAAANGAYLSGYTVFSVAIAAAPTPLAPQTLTINAPAANTSLKAGATAQMAVSNSAGSAGGALSYASSTPAACSVSSTGLITAGQTGGLSCIVTVTAAANSAYLVGSTAVTVAIAAVPTTLGSQTLTISVPTANASLTAGATAQMVVSNSAGSAGGALSYTSSTPTACSVSNTGLITAGQTGGLSCIVTVTAAATSAYLAGSTAVTVAIAAAPTPMNPQTVTISSPAANASLAAGSTVQMVVNNSAGAGGGGIKYSSSGAGCAVSATGLVTGTTAAQTCTISVYAVANATHTQSPTVTHNLTITKVTQTLTSTLSATSIMTTASATLTASSSAGAAGGSISYASTTPAVCSIAAATGVITPLTAGSCVVHATASGNTNYEAATSASQSLTISLATQTLAFTSPSASTTLTVGNSINLAATSSAGSNGGAITYASLSPSVCTVEANLLKAVASGLCNYTATAAGSKLYASANQSAGLTVSAAPIVLMPQTVTISSPAADTSIAVGSNVQMVVSNSAGSAGGSINYSSTGTGCAVSATGSVTANNAGQTCTISAYAIANATHAQSPTVTRNLTVTKRAQTLTPTLSTSSITTTGSATLTATSSLGTAGGTITYATATPSICSMAAATGVITPLAAGNCLVYATAAGDANTDAATSENKILVISLSTQTITFTAPTAGTTLTVGSTTTVAATSSAGSNGGAMVYTSLNPYICTIEGNVLKAVSAGLCAYYATAAGSNLYATNYQFGEITINAAPIVVIPQTLTISSPTANAWIGVGATAQMVVSNSAGAAGGSINYSSTGTGCTVSSTGLITATNAVQACAISVFASANAAYEKSPTLSLNLTITKGTQTLTPTLSAASIETSGSASLTATSNVGSASGSIYYDTKTPTICDINSAGVITPLAVGSCEVYAIASGSSNYDAATSVTKTLTISLAAQTLTFTSPSADLNVGSSLNLVATSSAGSNGGAITYSSLNPSVCTVVGNVLRGVAPGLCSYTATAAGSSTYSNAIQIGALTVTAAPLAQTLTISAPAANTVVTAGSTTQISVGNTAGSAGGTLNFSATPASACTVNAAGLVTAVTGGQVCTVSVYASANAAYLASASVSVPIQIGMSAQTISITNPTANQQILVGNTQPIFVSGSAPGATLSYGVAAGSTGCSVSSSGVVTALVAGSPCTVTAVASAVGAYPVSNTASVAVTIIQTVVPDCPPYPKIDNGTAGAISLTSTANGARLCDTNVLALYMDTSGGISPAAFPLNRLYATVQVCAPGSAVNSSDCAIVDHVVVDTGSTGLRLFQSALEAASPGITNKLPQVKVGSNVQAECVSFVSSSMWGGVRTADLHMGGSAFTGQTAPSLPIQVLNDSAVANARPSGCLAGFNAPASIPGNGVLGIGWSQQDCGSFCTGNPQTSSMYWSCTATSCSSLYNTVLNTVVSHPILYTNGTDRNGYSISMPPLPSANSTSNLVSGLLVMGVDTRANNKMPTTGKFIGLVAALGSYIPMTFNGSATTYNVTLDTGAPTSYLPTAIPGSMGCTNSGQFLCASSPSGTTVPINLNGTASNLILPYQQFPTGVNAASNLVIATGGPKYILGIHWFLGRTITSVFDSVWATSFYGPAVHISN